eukprot:2420521-Rhodomonas_salina.2
MLLRRAKMLNEEGLLRKDELEVAEHCGAKVVSKEANGQFRLNEDQLDTLRSMVSRAMARKAEQASTAQESNPSPLADVLEKPDMKSKPHKQPSMCNMS